MAENSLLVVDDEPSICDFVSDVAVANGYDVKGCRTLDDLRRTLDEFEPTLVMLDLNMPDGDGIEVLRHFHDTGCAAKVMLVSGEGRRVLESALRLGRDLGIRMEGFIEKPIDLDRLEHILTQNRSGRWLVTEGEIERGLDHGEFETYFQPKIKKGGDGIWTIFGLEALVRWVHPQFGVVGPDRFIPVAEQLAVIDRLTERVISQSGQALRNLRQRYHHRLSISVNISTRQLSNIDLPDQILRLLDSEELDPREVVLEVTERGIMNDLVNPTDVLTRCRLKGFGLSMDDFGTGYSSLTHLAELPFSEIKIDKSFVMTATSQDSSRVIIRSCIALAHALELDVCAEGVETHDALDLLDRFGCDQAQGYFVSRPVPASEIPSLVENFRYRRV